MADQKKSDWPFILGGLVCIGLIGGIYSLFTQESFFSGFTGSLRAFGIAVAILGAYIGVGAAGGYAIGKARGNPKGWASGGGVVGLVAFLIFGQAGL